MLRLELFIRRVPSKDNLVLVSDHYFDNSELVSIDYIFSIMKRGVRVITYPITSKEIKQIIWNL